ncbi:preprotein translocase subunit SecE [Paraglaciecola hydrolytica]|uniref:Protein translocase subunit SecE n=1 Tax=Paraglaciecola hydrolytica TaxID=1799789 RepID=A0A148KKN1_9ALTE|nr:preprotein translocase subunit SecE [Paraglaciecola hydrolytica]KXI26847.1 preprotein translocase subunit SecE [Paraglaciecola hydrolytica]
MSENTVNNSSPFDLVKWVVTLALLVGIVAADYIYDDVSVLIRALGAVVAVGIAGFIASTTEKGSAFINFAKDARIEVRKVVWPTRQESTQTTIIVLIATAVIALLIYFIDWIIVELVSFITGLGI